MHKNFSNLALSPPVLEELKSIQRVFLPHDVCFWMHHGVLWYVCKYADERGNESWYIDMVGASQSKRRLHRADLPLTIPQDERWRENISGHSLLINRVG
jgi:hypothetical protein